MAWYQESQFQAKPYKCGYCNYTVSSNKGFYSQTEQLRKIYICPHCNQPSYFDFKKQYPGIVPGNDVAHLPEDLDKLYEEARNSCGVNAYTAAVLACRKLLMNIAVSQGATQGKDFLSYVNYLAEAGYVPPHGRGWVDHIRKKGNEATHEISLMSQADAEELISFAEMLMKFIYEFPNKIPTNKTFTS